MAGRQPLVLWNERHGETLETGSRFFCSYHRENAGENAAGISGCANQKTMATQKMRRQRQPMVGWQAGSGSNS
jgi:hypothetical protein